MNRVAKPTVSQASVEVVRFGEVAVVDVTGLVDERFGGFGTIDAAASVVINVSGITRLTSFGVRQWLKSIDALPKRLSELFMLGCPTFFVDQLNMVLNFGGSAKVLTVVAPYTCTSCGVESGETIDVLAERTNLANGAIPEKQCSRCEGKLEFDESPESYFSFVSKYGATTIEPRTAEALASRGLYAARDSGAEKPPRIIKLVNDSVTYFRIIGRIGSLFRARPFLVGAEGDVVIDFSEVESYDSAAQKEWRRLLKNLSSQVSSITLVDVKESFVPQIGDTLTLGGNISLASLLIRQECVDCGETSYESEMLNGTEWPPQLASVACGSCHGITRAELSEPVLAQLSKLNRTVPEAAMSVIAQRSQLLSRALSDANAHTSETAATTVGTDDAILGKYKIVRRLTASASAISDTFLAKQVGIGGFEKPVVLKKFARKLLEERQQSSELLLDEVRSAGRLTHPNIVQALDVGELDGALYVAMEYVNGKSLAEIIEQLKEPMPVAAAMHIVREVANALDHAFSSTDMAGQQLAMVHGDLNPHNIMISYDGAVKVLDFGVMTTIIREGADAPYMAPESAVDGVFEHTSDLFSLGVLLYVLCSGSTPFPGSGPKSIFKKVRGGRFRTLEEAVGAPPALDNLVSVLLSFNPVDRPQSAGEIVAELTDIARRNGLESSNPTVGALVARLFPVERGGKEDGSRLRASGTGASPSIAAKTDQSSPVRTSATEARTSRGRTSTAHPARSMPRAASSGTTLRVLIVLLVAVAICAGMYYVGPTLAP